MKYQYCITFDHIKFGILRYSTLIGLNGVRKNWNQQSSTENRIIRLKIIHKTFTEFVKIAWRSGSVMDCHATARG